MQHPLPRADEQVEIRLALNLRVKAQKVGTEYSSRN